VNQIPVMRPWLGAEEAEAAAAAVASGWVAQGPRVVAFETAFAQKVDAPHAVATSSCTTALHLALVLTGVGPGDEVVVPSLSFIATANVVRHVGAEPVFTDVDEATGNVTAGTIEAALTPRTRAVIAVDQAGVPADLDPIRALCHDRGLRLIEDAACAHGSTYRGQPVGHGAELAAFSFHPRKLITTGEGGMLVVADEEQAARARRLREHGMSVAAADRHGSARTVIEHYDEVGFNHRMTDVQAAIGLVQLGRLDAIVRRRRALAAAYHERLGDLLPEARAVADPAYGTTNFQSFWVVLPEGAPSQVEVLDHLLSEGISARRGIMASHLERAYASGDHRPLPVTERLSARSIILPLHHELEPAEQDLVVETLATVVTGKAAASSR
jgi:dTDP-4-amino-4,6-dideoxygalactose transaminase